MHIPALWHQVLWKLNLYIINWKFNVIACLSAYLYTTYVPWPWRPEEGIRPLGLEFQTLWAMVWVLRNELGSSRKASNTLNGWAVSLQTLNMHLKLISWGHQHIGHLGIIGLVAMGTFFSLALSIASRISGYYKTNKKGWILWLENIRKLRRVKRTRRPTSSRIK